MAVTHLPMHGAAAAAAISVEPEAPAGDDAATARGAPAATGGDAAGNDEGNDLPVPIVASSSASLSSAARSSVAAALLPLPLLPLPLLPLLPLVPPLPLPLLPVLPLPLPLPPLPLPLLRSSVAHANPGVRLVRGMTSRPSHMTRSYSVRLSTSSLSHRCGW